MPSQLENAALAYRRALAAREAVAAGELTRAYGQAWRRVNAAYRQALARPDSANTLAQRARWASLQAQIEREIATLGGQLDDAALLLRREAALMAQGDALALMEHALGSAPPQATATVRMLFDKLPTAAVEQMLANAAEGSPLRTLFQAMAPGQAANMTDELAASIAAGVNPRVAAARLRSRFGVPLARALRVARTEMLRTYRDTSLQTYKRNRDVVTGWVWHSALDRRTCASCWAMHGTFHRLEERLDDHPNGRCAMLPRTKSWQELGFDLPDTRPVIERGADRFAALSSDDQDGVLGIAGGAAYRAGRFALSDVVGRRRSAVWGTMRYARSLREILGTE